MTVTVYFHYTVSAKTIHALHVLLKSEMYKRSLHNTRFGIYLKTKSR